MKITTSIIAFLIIFLAPIPEFCRSSFFKNKVMNCRIFYIITCFFFLISSISAQNDLPLPGEFYSRNDKDWYNRKTGITKFLIHIQEGAAEKAIQQANKHEGDAEADFVRAIAYAHLGENEHAINFMKASLEKDLPMGRYLAGDPLLVKPLRSLPGFEELKGRYPTPLVHGPMLGNLTSQSATFWCRTDGERNVEIEVSRTKTFKKKRSGQNISSKQKEYTTTITIDGLKAATLFFYRVKVDGQLMGDINSFTTFPKKGKGAQFSIAFGGGAGFIPWHHRLWSTIRSHQPDALFLQGDNVYIDYPERPEIQQYCYYRRQSEPYFRNLVSHTPTFAIWDDHDFGDNDDYGTPDPDFPAWKPKVLKVFKNQWVDPCYGGRQNIPGVFFSHSIGDVDFFFLDGRYYRQPSEVGAKHERPLSMLGKAQKQWLKDQLLQSKATFKVIISPVPWAFDAKPAMSGRIDTWGGYREERTEIFDFLADNEIEGVFLLSSDRHRSDIWKIDRPNSYPLYEFESSRLTNTHYHKVMPESLYSYNKKCSFGKLVFDTTADDPRVEYHIINIDNVVVNRFILMKSSLKHLK